MKSTHRNYEVRSDYRRFNQKHNNILRPSWDPKFAYYKDRMASSIAKNIADREPGHDQFGYALASGAVTGVESLGTGINTPDSGLTSWTPLFEQYRRSYPFQPGRVSVDAPTMRRDLEKVSRYFGADIVGFTPLDERWVYSNHYLPATGENPPVELPEGCDQVIVMGVELDFEMMRTAPTAVMTAETSWNYSRMALLVASVAEFIRSLGYTAIPSINDTALNAPLAIDAGLAQPSRAGYVITEKYGPRIRFCKVITDMPLEATVRHVDLGVKEFCEACKKCAEACPPQALPLGDMTYEGFGDSNNPGVLKWYANYEKCRKYWAAIGTNCGICMRVCPFNEGRGFHHDVVRWLVRRKSKPLDRLLVRVHDWLGTGNERNPARTFWGRRGRQPSSHGTPLPLPTRRSDSSSTDG